MIKLTDKPKEIWAVEVPDKIEQIEVLSEDDGGECLAYFYGENIDKTIRSLPPGNWRYICTSKGIDEGQAEEIVDKSISQNIWYKDYLNGGSFWKAIDSLNSLLASKGLDGNKNYCLIEKM